MASIGGLKWRIAASLVLYGTVVLSAFFWKTPIRGCRGQRPNSPLFNGYLLSYEGTVCHDLPLVDVMDLDAKGRDGRFAQNADEHHKGVTANIGDTVRILVWFHNSGSTTNRAKTTARHVRIGTVFDTAPSIRHRIAAFLSADNAETVSSADDGGDAFVNTATPTIFQSIPGTTKVCFQAEDALERGLPTAKVCGDYPNGKIRYSHVLPDEAANASVMIGHLKADDAYTGYVLIHLKVVESEPHK